MIQTMTVNKDVMKQATKQDFSNATELADYLAKKECRSEKRMKWSGNLCTHASKEGSI